MQDASQSQNGLLLRGSSTYESQALSLLQSYANNFELAKFHIMNAEQMAIPHLKCQYVELFTQNPAVLQKVVKDQMQELRGCKKEDIETAISQLRELFNSANQERVSPGQLEIITRAFVRMRIMLPDDINQLIQAAEEFSKQIKKRVNPQVPAEKRLTLPQLR